jgi:hypothetical protein
MERYCEGGYILLGFRRGERQVRLWMTCHLQPYLPWSIFVVKSAGFSS